MTSKLAALIIMDGWGVAAPSRGNAATLANMPFLDYSLENYPSMLIEAAGLSVGLPWGEMGNSEVGHLTIGAGKIVFQNLTRINKAIESGEFFKNKAFLLAIDHVKKNNSRLHLVGLLGLGGVHAHQLHLESLMQLAQDQGVPQAYLHLFLDGRDSLRDSALKYLEGLNERIKERSYGIIASLCGRYWSMDRDKKWDRINKGYNLLTKGQAEYSSDDPSSAIKESYSRQVFDEEFEPTIITQGGQPIATIQEGDAVIFFNFRSDRGRQLTQAFVEDDFDGFQRGPKINNLFFTTMTEYMKDLPAEVAFPRDHIREPLGKVISDNNLKQLHVAETEKYAHVTFFINGLQEVPYPGEDRGLVPSPLVDSYAKTPAMSGDKITQEVLSGLDKDKYSFIVMNYANTDMVAHTGDLQSTVKGLEANDKMLEQVVTKVLQKNGTVMITSDHGNCEELVKLQTGELDKEHSNRPVPYMIINEQLKGRFSKVSRDQLYSLQSRGTLVDVAPTILSLLGLPKPREMKGIDLLKLVT
ncbi:2,3-bisphosphoglycerate-independent phosphoglycerate mutase [Patescibacteria group bacterium]|nr:2,3-bisphosphoglycerate-independent phosphoglycerate mutase [Patescibacteria group bacterium]MBU1890259.1 2,3-bisphosphoglycerate-independent phosphoglycerate mutase [Patescibacteria group bacterium]